MDYVTIVLLYTATIDGVISFSALSSKVSSLARAGAAHRSLSPVSVATPWTEHRTLVFRRALPPVYLFNAKCQAETQKSYFYSLA